MGPKTGGSTCWCGGRSLEPLREDYARCGGCGTLVFVEPYDCDHYGRVDDEAGGFYGPAYWLDHVPRTLGLPSLEERAWSDLCERAVFLLQRILERLPPEGSLLELGAAPGSLSFLLGQSGFEVEAIEMSAPAIEFMTRTFGLTVQQGPLEESCITRSFLGILAIDVLEHLPHPLTTMKACADRLEDDGLLFLQTPCYRDDGPEWEMYLPGEHLFLFDEDSVRALLQRAGFKTIECHGSLFPYDMWVVASKSGVLQQRSTLVTSLPPAVRALIRCFDEAQRLRTELTEVDGDRRAKEAIVLRLGQSIETERTAAADRLEQIEALTVELSTIRKDQRAKDDVIDRLTGELKSVDGDRRAKADLIVRLSDSLEVEKDAATRRQGQVDELTGELQSIRRDQQEKDELIKRITVELEAVDGDRQAKEDLVARLSQSLEIERGAASRRLDRIEALTAELEEVDLDRHAKDEVIERLATELEAVDRDRRAKDDLVARLGDSFETEKAAAARRLDQIEELTAELKAVRHDQRAKDEVIERLNRSLETEGREASRRLDQIKILTAEIEAVRKDQSAKDEVIQSLLAEREGLEAEVRSARESVRHLRDRVSELENHWFHRLRTRIPRLKGDNGR